MPACQIEDYHDSPLLREDLIAWLVSDPRWPLSTEVWRQRLRHWWDENPFAAFSPARGWLVRHEGRIVGFMGLIPACAAVNGAPQTAYAASSWRVEEPHRNASLPMLMKLRRLAATTLLADTTPTPDVQVLLQKSGWTPATAITRRFVPLGLFSLPWRGRWPRVPAGKKIIRDPAEVRSVAASFQVPGRIEKWITPEYLRWFAASPRRRHEFIGLIDSSGCLTSYLFLAPKTIQRIPSWMEIDHFTTSGDFSELHALVGELARDPSKLGPERLLSLASFPGDAAWDDAPVVHGRAEVVTHHFAIPEPLKMLPKHSVLAEGDWGF